MEERNYRREETKRQCDSYRYNSQKELERCTSEGRPRVDNGLAAGVHCDSCWDEMVKDARSRSW